MDLKKFKVIELSEDKERQTKGGLVKTTITPPSVLPPCWRKRPQLPVGKVLSFFK